MSRHPKGGIHIHIETNHHNWHAIYLEVRSFRTVYARGCGSPVYRALRVVYRSKLHSKRMLFNERRPFEQCLRVLRWRAIRRDASHMLHWHL
jgi:hypothetical protein